MKVRILTRQGVNENTIHARVEINRGQDWCVIGVLLLPRSEWLRLAAVIARHEVEIRNEAEISTNPTRIKGG